MKIVGYDLLGENICGYTTSVSAGCILRLHIYPIQESITLMRDIRKKAGEKPCIGIMLFHNFTAQNKVHNYTNDISNVMPILELLNPDDFRLSFCEYNPIEEIGESEPYCYDEAMKIIELVQERGFEAKYFSSFGREKKFNNRWNLPKI